MAASAAPPDAPDAARIVASLRRELPARTPFVEVRWSSLLDRPLVLRGELEYAGPGHLSRRVEAPYREEMTVAGGEASVQRGDREARTFPLGQAPELEGFLRGFQSLLGGDAQALANDFTLSASGTDDRWRLVLKPRDARLARRIQTIQVDGSAAAARCFRTQEADGDLSVLLVEAAVDAPLPRLPSQPQVDAICRSIDAR